MFVRVILESAISESLFLLFLLRTLTPASTRKSFFDLGTSFFFSIIILYIIQIEWLMNLHILNGSGTPNISKIDPPECTILDS